MEASQGVRAWCVRAQAVQRLLRKDRGDDQERKRTRQELQVDLSEKKIGFLCCPKLTRDVVFPQDLFRQRVGSPFAQ